MKKTMCDVCEQEMTGPAPQQNRRVALFPPNTLARDEGMDTPVFEIVLTVVPPNGMDVCQRCVDNAAINGAKAIFPSADFANARPRVA